MISWLKRIFHPHTFTYYERRCAELEASNEYYKDKAINTDRRIYWQRKALAGKDRQIVDLLAELKALKSTYQG